MAVTVRFKRGWFAPSKKAVIARKRDGSVFFSSSGKRYRKGETHVLSEDMFELLKEVMGDKNAQGGYKFFVVEHSDEAPVPSEEIENKIEEALTLKDFDHLRAEGESFDSAVAEGEKELTAQEKTRTPDAMQKARKAKQKQRMDAARETALQGK